MNEEIDYGPVIVTKGKYKGRMMTMKISMYMCIGETWLVY